MENRIGSAIAFLRKRAGYTQKDLADRLGISDKAISKWERGLGLPDTSYLAKLSILLDTDTDSLLSGDVIRHDKNWHGLLILSENNLGINASTVIFDKPLVYYLLSYFLLVGIKIIHISCNEKEKNYITEEFGYGEKLGIRLSFSGTDFLDSLQGSSFSECRNMMIVFKKSIVYGVDQTKFFQKAMQHRDRITLLSLPKGFGNNYSRIIFNENKKIVSSEDEEKVITQYDYHTIPICFCPKEYITDVCENLLLVDEKEKRESKDSYSLYTEVLDRGYVELPIDTWENVADASQFVRIVQSACGMKIYCPEEIAWRRGLITIDEMKKTAEIKENRSYGKYLASLN